MTFRKFAKVFGLTCTVLAAGIMAIQILSEPEPSAERPAWGPLIGGEGHFDDQPVIGCPTADPWKDYKSRNVMTGEVYWQRVMAPAGCRLFIARGARGTFKVPGIVCREEGGVLGGRTHSELIHVALSNHDDAGGIETGHERCVIGRHKILEHA